MLRAEVLETMLYSCVTWSPRACHYDTLRGARHSFLTRCISWQINNLANYSISYLDTLVETGSVNIEATKRRRWISFAGFAALVEDTGLPKCMMFGEGLGARAASGARKKSGSGISWTTSEVSASTPTVDDATQDAGEWRRTVKQGAERFMAK